MDFATIGNVRTYARMANLKFAMKYRLRTGQSIVNSNGNINIGLLGAPRSSFVDQMMKTQKQRGDDISKKRLAAIKRKLMNGKKLSNEEMGFLLKNDSKLYNKAKRVEESREELKAALHRAKTKDEARKALMHAMMKASAECTAELDAAKSAGGGGGVAGGGGYAASGDVGGMAMSAGGDVSAAMPSGGDTSSVSNVSTADVSSQAVGDPNVGNQTVGNQNVGNQNPSANKNLSNGNNFGNVNETQTSSEKDSPQDILEKFIMIIRALEDEWAQFSKSKHYKDLPEDHDDEQKIGRKRPARTDYKAYDVATAYRAAMNLSFVED